MRKNLEELQEKLRLKNLRAKELKEQEKLLREQEKLSEAQARQRLREEIKDDCEVSGRIPEGRVLCSVCSRRLARKNSTVCSRCGLGDLESKLRDTLPGLESTSKHDFTLPGVKSVPNQTWAHPETGEFVSIGPAPEGAFVKKVTWREVPLTDEEKVEQTLAKLDKKEPARKYQLEVQTVIPVPSSTEPTYNRRQVAKMLGVSQTSILRWEKKGKIPQPVRLAHNGQCLYTDENVRIIREYMAQTYVAPQQVLNEEQKKEKQLKVFSKKASKLNLSRRAEKAVAARIKFTRPLGNL